jgi:transcriptional regulator CtsR
MNIDSYDSEQKQRKNIISSLVSRTGNKISADSTSSVLIDLLNTNAIDLRNIKMRLVDSDFNKIEIDGEQVATIIIAQKDESIGTL